MNTLPASIVSLLEPFERMFSPRTWRKAQTLAIGAMLAPGKRTVTSALRVMGMGDRGDFSVYHQVLNRARWSPLKISRVLLMLLIDRLDSGEGPLVFGMDDTVERRWGKRIAAKGIYHDAPRSSRSHFAKTTGIRWLSLMWLSDVPWAERVWALPFLTVLAPSERYHRMMGRRHKRLVDFAMQMLVCLRRWLPDRDIVVVADRSYAALRLLSFCQKLRRPITLITRLRMDAALYAPAHPCLRGATWTSQSGRRQAAQALRNTRRPGHELDRIHACMVRLDRQNDGDSLWNSGVEQRWQTPRSHQMGDHPGP